MKKQSARMSKYISRDRSKFNHLLLQDTMVSLSYFSYNRLPKLCKIKHITFVTLTRVYALIKFHLRLCCSDNTSFRTHA